ncbi:MAG: hypothetical protein LIO71_03200 [Ruminococcus sp.]|nr:hypothetical protein [Ruminococcus sp.]
MTREQEIEKHMKLLQISREEAEQLYNDDHSDEVLPEVAEMETKAKQLKRRYEGDTKARKPAQRTSKPDEEKIRLVQILNACLRDCGEVEKVNIANQQKEITFSVGENEYSVTLTRHRKKKEG